MSNALIGALRVNLGLDSANFERGAKRSQNTLKTMRNQFAVVAGAAAAMVTAISAAALRGARDIDEAAKASRRLGSSIGGFRAAQLAAGEMGVSISGLTDTLQTMNREIERGSKGAMEALDKLKISADDLAGLDADEKLALIADQVQELGLNADQASVLLQDLGIRNREMVLAVLDGGDAFRNARSDIDSYGLALSSVDASRIEQANDQIGRLGLISQYAGQQLALALVPAMGRLAQAMTDSLREGGLLRAVIDGLADNIERLGTYVAVAVTAFGVRYVGALVAARLATLNLSTALIALRGALLRTGIGILIVGAGELVFQLARLVSSVGGFGNALKLMGDVARGVWDGIKTSAEAIPPALGAVWETIKRTFANLMSDLAERWSSFLNMIANAGSQIPGIGSQFDRVTAAADRAMDSSIGFAEAANAARDEAERLADVARGKLSRGFNAARTSLGQLNQTVKENEQSTDSAADAGDRLNEALENVAGSGGGGSGGGGGSAKDAADAIKGLNEELQETPQWVDGVSNAWGDFVVGGLRDFKSFAQSVIGTFRNMLRDMIAMAARNRIMLSIGMGGSAAGTAAQAAGGFGGAGGMLGAAGGIGSALVGGFTNTAGAFMGGIGTGFSAIGGQVATAIAAPTATAIAGAIGAVALPLLAVGGIIAAIVGSTKEIDRGLRVTVDQAGTLVETFRETERRRLFGLIKSRRTSTGAADSATADPIREAVAQVQRSTIAAASALGIASDAFKGFTTELNISLKGLSEDQAAQAIAEALGGVGDAMAAMIPNIENFRIGSETTSEALVRMGSSLQLVNGMFAAMDYQLYAVSLAGGQMASSLVELLGGLQGFSDATSFFVANFYSDAEQLQVAANALHAEFKALNIATPRTAEEFRRLVESQDLTTEAGQRTYAALMQVAPAFASVAQAAANAANTANAAAAQATGAVAQTVSALEVVIPEQRTVAAAQADAVARQAAIKKAMDQAAAAARRQAAAAAAAQRASAAQAAAQQAANEAMRAAQAIANERFGLETRYFQAIGDLVTLREREIAALDPANQAFGRMVMMLEDAKRAADSLQQSDFASMVDFNRAQARALNMTSANFNAPIGVSATAPSVSSTPSAIPGGGALTAGDQRELIRLLSLIERNTKDTVRGVEDLMEDDDGGKVLAV